MIIEHNDEVAYHSHIVVQVLAAVFSSLTSLIRATYEYESRRNRCLAKALRFACSLRTSLGVVSS